MKILVVGAELFSCGRTDRHTNVTKFVVACRNFGNVPSNFDVLLTVHLSIILSN